MIEIDRKRLDSLLVAEEQRFHKDHPKSYELYRPQIFMAVYPCFG
jgi:hypothetical protein